MSRSERVVQQLGMSHGTACNRLRKNLLFRQLKKHNDNVCIRCHLEIESSDDLSIEHIQPWEGRSAELFWDLDNVAFSHISCNRPHSNGAEKLRKIGPVGTAWCFDCKQFKNTVCFSKSTREWDGLDNLCKVCKNVRNFSRDRSKPDSSSDKTLVS